MQAAESFKGRLLLRACVHGHGVFKFQEVKEITEEAWCTSAPTSYSPGERAEAQGGQHLPESGYEVQSSEPLVSVWLAAGKIETGTSRCGGLPFPSQDLGRRGRWIFRNPRPEGSMPPTRAMERDPVWNKTTTTRKRSEVEQPTLTANTVL